MIFKLKAPAGSTKKILSREFLFLDLVYSHQRQRVFPLRMKPKRFVGQKAAFDDFNERHQSLSALPPYKAHPTRNMPSTIATHVTSTLDHLFAFSPPHRASENSQSS